MSANPSPTNKLNERIAAILGWKHTPEAKTSGHTSDVQWAWQGPPRIREKDGKQVVMAGMRRKHCPDFCGVEVDILKRNFAENGWTVCVIVAPDGHAQAELRKDSSSWAGTLDCVSESMALATLFLEAVERDLLPQLSGHSTWTLEKHTARRGK